MRLRERYDSTYIQYDMAGVCQTILCLFVCRYDTAAAVTQAHSLFLVFWLKGVGVSLSPRGAGVCLRVVCTVVRSSVESDLT